jgi:autotransporter-associated beta strand protein
MSSNFRLFRRGLLLAAISLMPALSSAQSPYVFYMNAATSLGGNIGIGGYHALPNTKQFWTAGFTGASQGLRLVTDTSTAVANQLQFDTGTSSWSSVAGPTNYTPELYLGESDWTRYVRSSSLTNNSGNGTFNSALSGQATPGNITLNPATLTIGGITYAPGQVAIIVDGMSVTGTGSTLSMSKTVYAYDLRKSGDPVVMGQRDRNANGIVDWNDVFETISTRQDFQTYTGGTATTFNMARTFAFSKSDPTHIYINDAASSYGGIWRVNLQATGPAALERVINVTVTDRINTEPLVISTTTRDLDAFDSLAGDQVLFGGSSYNGVGVNGGIAYFTHNVASNTTSGPRFLTHGSRIQAVQASASSDLSSITSDTAGNIYFQEGTSRALMRLDTKGRLSKIGGNEQRTAFQVANGTGSNAAVLDLSTRTVTLTNGVATYPVTEVMYGDSAGNIRAPVGVLAFDAADLNRDGTITAADTAIFINEFNRSISVGTPLQRTDTANYQSHLAADLNGTAVYVSAQNGLTANAINNRDIITLFQFINKVPGDANLDGTVDAADQVILTSGLVAGTGNWLQGDFNRDGLINTADQTLLTTNLGTSYSLAGYDPQASYTGGAIGTWADVTKSGAVPVDADTNITIARTAGAAVTGPATSTTAVYVDLGTNQVGGPTNALTLQPGTTLQLTEGMVIRPTGQLNFDSGAILRTGISGSIATLAVLDGGQIGSGFTLNGSLNFNTSTNATITGTIANFDASTLATVVKVGAGTLTMTNPSTYSGGTTISGGTLLVTNTSGSATGTGAVTVVSGTVLGGTGTITGATTVTGGISPGVAGIGTLNIANAVTWNGATGNNWASQLGTPGSSLASSGTSDLLNITGNFTKGSGTVFPFDFANTGNSGWYKLVDWTGTTTFTSSNFSALNIRAGGTAAFTVDATTTALYVQLTIPEWVGAAAANWSATSSWSNSVVPNSTTATANFLGLGAGMVTVDTPQTVNQLVLNVSTPSYTIAGTSRLSLAGTTPTITNTTGTNTISAPLDLANGTAININAGTLAISPTTDNTIGTGVTATVANSATLQLGGAGNALNSTTNITNAGSLSVTSTAQSVGNISGAGSTTVSGAGTSATPTLIAKDIDQSGLTINNGAYVRIAPSGTSTITVTSLTLGTTANLDISDNDIVVNNPTPVAAASSLTAITARVNAGFVSGGNGIVTTTTGSGLETVGFGLNSFLSYPTFNGVTINDDSVLIKYTYFGDSNLDGFVTDDDLGYFLAGYGTNVSGNPWILGDYNHDGFTTDDDLGFFLAAYGSTPGLAGGGIQAIPEPSTLVLGTLAGLGLSALSLRRRRAK